MADRSRGRNALDFMLFYGGKAYMYLRRGSLALHFRFLPAK